MWSRIKQFFRSGSLVDNIYGFHCPTCVEAFHTPTAWMRMMWDEKEKCFKKYIQCNECMRTTPAYKDKREAFNQWEIIQGTETKDKC